MKESVFKKRDLRSPVSISLSKNEKKAIASAAKKEGLSMSEYIRQASMHLAQT